MKDEQIKAFFLKQCSPEEAAAVVRFLNANPSEMKRWLPESEWQGLTGESADPEIWNDVWKKIDPARRRQQKIRRLVFVGAAAAIAGLLLVTFRGKEIRTVSPTSLTAASRKARAGAPVNAVRTVDNHGNKNPELLLPDGSGVTLETNAVLRYEEPFLTGARNVHLTGAAYFRIAPDKSRPFSVFAGSFSTTALGTEFHVALTAAGSVKIHLLKGRVVIRSIAPHLKGWNRDVFLMPGEQMNYDMLLAKTSVVQRREPVIPANRKSAPSSGSEEEIGLTFSGEALPAALNRLSTFYRTDIFYDTVLLKRMHFSGQISHKDSLSAVLKVIAQMNHLQVDSTDRHFILRR